MYSVHRALDFHASIVSDQLIFLKYYKGFEILWFIINKKKYFWEKNLNQMFVIFLFFLRI